MKGDEARSIGKNQKELKEKKEGAKGTMTICMVIELINVLDGGAIKILESKMENIFTKTILTII